ncbi:eukaryotic translation initiation factor 3 subunit J-like [Gossypium australe]|uniref:Eukaryotic translation initiation factor 3 subunit J-like n=1 Tax=Gossypium australe TaxID=47621 RepID=A0A5B6WEY1_9ROSI|nr:eukaryotic translation initiation factor 3 subunit J-like [Gossypium australe]
MTKLYSKKGDDKTLDNFIPKSKSDFVEYAELISHKLCPYEESYHYIALLKAAVRLSLTSLKVADVKDITSSVTTILARFNGKIAIKEKKSSKKRPRGLKVMGSMESDSD